MNEYRDVFKIAAVIVTFNRLELLKECIFALRKQTREIDSIVVVNNGSRDGTSEWLNVQNDIITVTQENLGGAGGFHTGIKIAYDKGFDWIWCMDDDTIVATNSLEELIKVISQKTNESIGFLSSKILWTDGSPHVMNLPGYFYNKNIWNYIGDEKFFQGVHKIDACSFVSCIFHKNAIREVGFPDNRFFIWFDDLEYTSRFINHCNYYVSNSVAVHKTRANISSDLISLNKIVDAKIYYGLRNLFYFYKSHNKSFLLNFLFKFILTSIGALLLNKTSVRVLAVYCSGIIDGLFGKFKFLNSSL